MEPVEPSIAVAGTVAVAPPDRYPVSLTIAYPERLSRLKTFFRIFLILPASLFSYLVYFLLAVAFPIGWTTVFWRKKYPDWLAAAVMGGLDYATRVRAYSLLLTDAYPSFARDQSPVALDFAPPPQGKLSRWRVVFWKSVLLVPHVVVLYFLELAVQVVTILAWFAILFTAHYPRGLFSFVTGVSRWQVRVAGYFASLNDRFPPFAFSEDAGPASKKATVICGIAGLVVIVGLTTLIGVAAANASDPPTLHVRYTELQQGRGIAFTWGSQYDPRQVVALDYAADPGDESIAFLPIPPGQRAIIFALAVDIRRGGSDHFDPDSARLKVRTYGKEGSFGATLITVDSKVAPANTDSEGITQVRVVFLVPTPAVPIELRVWPGSSALSGLRWIFDY